MPAVADQPRQFLSGTSPRERFPESEYVHVPNVLVFREHRTQTGSGRELKFTPTELMAVANRCNERIRQSGDYAGIIVGHTPTKEAREQGVPSPPLVGFAGPFRAMPIPGEQPERWGVFADFWLIKEDGFDVSTILKRYPRRSAELWVEDRYEDMFLDPIALLGGEAPRLDMGLVYSRYAHGRGSVEIYQAAAVPGAGNVFIPTETETRKYEAASMLDENDIRQIVDAIRELPELQWAKSQMGGGETDTDPGEEPPPAETDMDVDPEPEVEDNAMDPADDDDAEREQMLERFAAMPTESLRAMWAQVDENEEGRRKSGKGYAKGRMKGNWHKSYQADNGDDDVSARDGGEELVKNKRYQASGSVEEKDANTAPAAGGVEGEGDPNRTASSYGTGDKEQYARLKAENQRLRSDLNAINGKLEEERGHRVNAQRKARLVDLASMGYDFDLDRYCERCHYSKMDDEAFESLCDTILDVGRPDPRGQRLYIPASAPSGSKGKGEPEKYSRQHIDETVRICTALRERGREPDYQVVLKAVANGKGGELLAN